MGYKVQYVTDKGTVCDTEEEASVISVLESLDTVYLADYQIKILGKALAEHFYREEESDETNI